MIEISLGDERYFRTSIGRRVLRRELRDMPEDASIPIYSANATMPWGHVLVSNIEDLTHGNLLWGIDENFVFNVIEAGVPFATTDHWGRLEVLSPDIDAYYLRFESERAKRDLDRPFAPVLAGSGNWL
jgi:hypothetical protein